MHKREGKEFIVQERIELVSGVFILKLKLKKHIILFQLYYFYYNTFLLIPSIVHCSLYIHYTNIIQHNTILSDFTLYNIFYSSQSCTDQLMLLLRGCIKVKGTHIAQLEELGCDCKEATTGLQHSYFEI